MKRSSIFTLLAGSAVVKSITFPQSGLGPGPNKGNIFIQANMSPNATGAVDLPATDITVDPMTGVETMWAAHLNITEVAIPSSTNLTTNAVISIDPLGQWVETRNWTTTIVLFLDVALNATVDGQKDTGDCHATLGEKCVRDYMRDVSVALRLASLDAKAMNTTEKPKIPAPPASCENRLTSTSVVQDFINLFADGSALFHSSSAEHSASDKSFYEEATTRIWPVLLYQIGKRGPDNLAGISATRMRCLRANATAEGSEDIGGVPGAAAGLRAYGWAAVAVSCLVGALLM